MWLARSSLVTADRLGVRPAMSIDALTRSRAPARACCERAEIAGS